MVRHANINQPLKNANSIITLILGLFFTVFAAGAVTYALARPHFWLRVENARATSAGESLRNANVYRSSRGMILICLPNSNGVQTEYVYYPSMQVLAVPDANEFSFRNGFAFAKKGFPTVDTSKLRHSYDDPTLVVGEAAFEFETNDGPVRIEMTEPLKLDIPHNYF
jgi:hypothetical protein